MNTETQDTVFYLEDLFQNQPAKKLALVSSYSRHSNSSRGLSSSSITTTTSDRHTSISSQLNHGTRPDLVASAFMMPPPTNIHPSAHGRGWPEYDPIIVSEQEDDKSLCNSTNLPDTEDMMCPPNNQQLQQFAQHLP
jgi:hypothetical protein